MIALLVFGCFGLAATIVSLVAFAIGIGIQAGRMLRDKADSELG